MFNMQGYFPIFSGENREKHRKVLLRMIFYSIEDFYEKAGKCGRMTRQEEITCAEKMKNGDAAARERMIESYIPMVADHIKRGNKPQTLGLVLYCVHALERAVDSFDFFQESETFTHRLSWWLRQTTVEYIVR